DDARAAGGSPYAALKRFVRDDGLAVALQGEGVAGRQQSDAGCGGWVGKLRQVAFQKPRAAAVNVHRGQFVFDHAPVSARLRRLDPGPFGEMRRSRWAVAVHEAPGEFGPDPAVIAGSGLSTGVRVRRSEPF